VRRSLLAIAVGLSLAAWAGTAHGDELVLYPGSQCRVTKKPAKVTPPPKPELDRVVDFAAPHFVLSRASAETCRVCRLDLDYEREQRARTVDAALKLAAPEPPWRSALRWGVVGAAIGTAFILGALLL
jgi:hypothetical protein